MIDIRSIPVSLCTVMKNLRVVPYFTLYSMLHILKKFRQIQIDIQSFKRMVRLIRMNADSDLDLGKSIK
jgi:hypothetical protein